MLPQELQKRDTFKKGVTAAVGRQTKNLVLRARISQEKQKSRYGLISVSVILYGRNDRQKEK